VRLLANENFPLPSVVLLRAAGHDVVSISEVDPAALDPAVIERAIREGRFILTFDRDYGDLIYHKRVDPPLGVIYLRLIPTSPEEPASIVLQVLAQPDVTLDGRFTVVSRREVRQRVFPPST
jgi:predicted nuclease of predicted toxin-antitoxin system